MSERRPTVGMNWRVREAVGIRGPRPRPEYGRDVLERLEDELRQFEREASGTAKSQDGAPERGAVPLARRFFRWPVL